MNTEHGSTLNFFSGFKPIHITTTGAVINGIIGGSGPPVLLLHGWPQSHVEWHRVAPLLADQFSVIATDLRGYGDSSIPPEGLNHEGYCKRAMALDQIEVMHALGFDRFAVVGHDRGARVGQRMALDYPDAVAKLVLIDIVPGYALYTRVTKEFATYYFHWFLLTQPAPLPETILGNNAEFILREWAFRGLIPDAITPEALAEYLRCFKNPARLHAMCEDYRAGATADLKDEKNDLDKKIQCPVFALWGAKGAMGILYDVLAEWRKRAIHARGKAFDGGHWLPFMDPFRHGEITVSL